MKLLRVGEKGKETVAALDKNNKLRDLSDHIKDLNPITLNKIGSAGSLELVPSAWAL